ncbi:MAG: peptide chain release factor 2 [bacterium]|nr:peptide chain release factor 2 [bacterium]
MPPHCGGYFDLDTSKEQIVELESQMTSEDFWQDQDRAREVSQRAADFRKEIEEWEGVNKRLDDILEYSELAEAEGEEADSSKEISEVTRKLDVMEMRTLFASKYDNLNAILELHAGSGGTEANDWTGMLLRMYMRFIESKGWKVSVLAESRAEEVGYKSVSLRVEGRYAYGHLKSEAGVHRLVRISPFDAEKMRHTTFALVDVIPEFEDVEVTIDPKDIRIETSTSQGAGGQSVNTTYSAIRIVHEPTGIVVSCQNERSQLQNKETALKVLKARLYKLELEKKDKQLQSIRGDVGSAEWGNQIRSYVLHPYKMVKDHRTEEETQDAEDVLDGDLDRFVEAYLRKEAEERRKISNA